MQNAKVGANGPYYEGTENQLRQGRTGEVMVGGVHGQYFETNSRGNLFTMTTPVAGIIITANMLISVASHNAIGLYNPTTSGVDLVITKAVLVVNAGTIATAGFFTWCCVPTATGITGAGVTTARRNNDWTTGKNIAKVFDGSVAVTASVATSLLRPFGGGMSGAIGAGVPYTFVEYLDGDIVAAPDTFVGLCGTIAGSVLNWNVGITWEEVPRR